MSGAVSRGELALVLALMRAFADKTQLSANQHEFDLVVLYDLMRRRPPDLFVELGRGEGCSTLLAALALAANRSGRIVSYDLHPLTSHDLPTRMCNGSCIEIDLRVGDIRALTPDAWTGLVGPARDVVVFIDAHEATGTPLADTLMPFVRAHRDIGWRIICHDVLHVEDRTLFDAFSDVYPKYYPMVSPYPEYGPTFPIFAGLGMDHFSRLGGHMAETMTALGVPLTMTPERAEKHRFADGVDPVEFADRFGRLTRSATMLVDLPAAGS